MTSDLGVWTADDCALVLIDYQKEMFEVIRSETHADLLSGDLALRRAVRNVYGSDHLPSENEMARVAERWRPYRSLAVSYLFSSEFEGGT